MKNCTDCKYAEWKRNKNGKLHASGEEKCIYPWKCPPLPASMYWLFMDAPRPSYGYINRKVDNKEDCVYFSRES